MKSIIDFIDDEFEKTLVDIIGGSSSDISMEDFNKTREKVIVTMLENADELLSDSRCSKAGFLQRHGTLWKDSINILELVINISTDAVIRYSDKCLSEDADITFHVIRQLHAKACVVARELLCLVKGGLADGAHTRWRTLHELTVVAFFIKKYGEECAIRYYWHDHIECYHGMQQHKRYASRLQAKAPTKQDLKLGKQNYDLLLEKFGKAYAEPYGWATFSLKKPNISFANLEKAVGLDHMRPYYKMSSYNVHAGSRAINFSLSAGKLAGSTLLLGESNAGMVVPMHSCAISLVQITTLFLGLKSELGECLVIETLHLLERVLGVTLINRQSDLDNLSLKAF
ncbi:MAG: DUF5677 domain-containing protein [Thiolinea sp.]